MAPHPPVSDFYASLRDGDLPGLRRALAAGADPNQPIGRETGDPLLPLVILVHQSCAFEKKDWAPLFQALLDAGARVLPPGPGRVGVGHHPLALAIAMRANEVFDLMIQRLAPADHPLLEQPVERCVLATDPSCSTPHAVDLLTVAAGANPHAFLVLWDTLGLRPVPSGPCPHAQAHGMPPVHRASALAQALAGPVGSGQEAVLARLLAHPWPQGELDQALRVAVRGFRSLPEVQALLEAGANPAAPGTAPDQPPHERLPPILQALCHPVPASPVPGVLAALLRHGADPHMRLDIEPGVGTDPAQVRLPPCAGAPGDRPALQDVSLLGLAAYHGHAAALVELVQAGNDPARRLLGTGLTPLHLAAKGACGMPERIAAVIKVLLEAGVDPATPDAQGKTALELWMERHEPDTDEPLPAFARETAARLVHDTLAAAASVGTPYLAERLQRLLLDRNLEEDDLVRAWSGALRAEALTRRMDQALPAPSPRPAARL